MLSKCANPACSAKLRYLREGKIFRVDIEPSSHAAARPAQPRSSADAPMPEAAHPTQYQTVAGQGDISRPEYFWLCGDCVHQVALAVQEGSVVVVPLRKPGVTRHALAS